MKRKRRAHIGDNRRRKDYTKWRFGNKTRHKVNKGEKQHNIKENKKTLLIKPIGNHFNLPKKRIKEFCDYFSSPHLEQNDFLLRVSDFHHKLFPFDIIFLFLSLFFRSFGSWEGGNMFNLKLINHPLLGGWYLSKLSYL